MAIPAIPEITNSDEETDGKQIRPERELTCISESALSVREVFRRTAARQKKEDERLRALLNTATGGGIERMLRNMNLSQSDKALLKRKGWRV